MEALKGAPERKEVQGLKFSRLCNLRLFPSCYKLDRKSPLNLVATSNKYGLIFAGTPTGVQCIPLSSVIQVQEKRPNNRGVIENYKRRDLKLDCLPSHISINSSGDLLGVVINHQGCPVLQIYVIQSFAGQDITKISEVRLSSTPGTRVSDLQWNPAIPNTIGAVISDGSTVVGEINLSGGAPTISVGPPTYQAMCLCWSPKGKQVVLGSKNGNLTQFKPDLKVVKSYPPPQIPNSQFEVVSVHWISSFQFIGVYKDRNNQEARSAVMVVNVPKSGQQSFINYEDICFGNDTMRNEHYFIHLAPWNLIFISTGNGLEVSVLSQEGDAWVQWLQDEGGRAELPQTENHDDVFAVGMALSVNATKPIPAGDSGSIPPMPFLLLMSEEGVLSLFHTINLLPSGGANGALCVPPQELPYQFFTVPEAGEPAAQTLSQPVQPQKLIATMSLGSGEAVQPAPVMPQSTLFPPSSSSPFQLGTQSGLSGSSFPSFSPFGGALGTQTLAPQASPGVAMGQAKSPQISLPQVTSKLTQSPFGLGTLQPTSSSGNLFGGLSSKPAEAAQSTASTLAPGGLGLQFPTSAAASTISIPQVSKPQPSFSTLSSATSGTPVQAIETFQSPVPKEEPRNPTPPPPVDDSMILTEIAKEVASFESIFGHFNLNSTAVKRLINDRNSLPSVTVKLDNLEKFEKELRETTATENAEVNALKLSLIELWGWLENIKAKQRLSTSQRFIDAVESKDLDPMMKKIMTSIDQNSLYLEIKIKEATDHLNSIWEKQKEPGSLKNFDIPHMEMIFQTMAGIMKILASQQTKVGELENKLASAMKARKKTVPQVFNDSNLKWHSNELTTSNKSQQNTQLEKLADKLLQTRIDSKNESTSRSFKETANRYIALSSTRKPLSAGKQAALWRWHKSHKVIHTKTTRPAVPDNDILNRLSLKITPTKTPVAAKPSLPIVETPQITALKPVSRNLFVTPAFAEPTNATSPSMVTSTPAPSSFKPTKPKPAGKISSPLPSPVEVSAPILPSVPVEPIGFLPQPTAHKNALNSPFGGVASSPKDQSDSTYFASKVSFITCTSESSMPNIEPVGATQFSFANLSMKSTEPPKNTSAPTKENLVGASDDSRKTTTVSDVKSPSSSSTLFSLLSKPTGSAVAEKDKTTTGFTSSSGSIFGSSPFGQTPPMSSLSFAKSGTSVFGGGLTSTAPAATTASSAPKDFTFGQMSLAPSVGTAQLQTPSNHGTPTASTETAPPATPAISNTSTSSTASSTPSLFSFSQGKSVSLAPSATQSSMPSLFGGALPTTTSVNSLQPSQINTSVVSASQFAQPPPATTSVSIFSRGAPATTSSTPSAASIQPVTPEKTATSTVSTSSISFGNMTLTPAPTASVPTATTPTTFSFTGAQTAPVATFATSQPQLGFGTTASQFGSVTTDSSTFGTTVTSPVTTTTTLFQTPQKSATAVSGAPAQSVFGTPTSSSPQPIFGTQTSPVQPSFGTPTTLAQPAFGTPTTTVQPAFGTPTTTVQSTFGSPLTSAQPTFETPTTSASVFNSSTSSASVFGSPTTTASVFGAANALSSTSFFGSPITTSAAFGSTPAANIFGGASSFSSPTTTSSIFGAAICSPNVSTAPTSSNVFGSPFASSASRTAFGGTPPFGTFKPANTTGSFGSSGGSLFGGNSTFGQQPTQGSPFLSQNSSPSVFGSPNSQMQSPGAFSSGGQTTVQQTGFGGFGRGQQQQQQQQPRPFGASGGAVFGGQATFGSTPTFGGTAAFGGSPTNKVFGSTNPAPAFGSPTQQSSTFENLAGQNTVSFGNLAQNQQPTFGSGDATPFGQQQQAQQQQQQQQQTAFSNTPAFGGSSFTSWR